MWRIGPRLGNGTSESAVEWLDHCGGVCPSLVASALEHVVSPRTGWSGSGQWLLGDCLDGWGAPLVVHVDW